MKRFPSGFLGTLVGFGIFVVIGVVVLTAFEKITDPWSVSLVGEPALVGSWWGEMRTPTGRTWVVHVGITATSVDDPRANVYMGGTAQVCDGGRDTRGFELSGSARNWRGTRFHLGARQQVERQGNRSVSGDPDTLTPVTFNLKRGPHEDFLAACMAMPALQPTFTGLPPLTQPVNDFADVVGARTLEIDQAIRALQADTRDVIVVVTVKSMAPFTDIAQYSMKVFENQGRGIGQAGADNGILVLLATGERQVRITTGTGVERIITNAEAAEIVRRMTIHFSQNRIGDGLLAGVKELAARLRAARASR